ncbi:hypothetical protein VE00_00202 [Pseudogymnoascus sp. WSF 3629]|nr:hypothetical protein VE00_00202 [Pseudogymnoascus sp. WSF 3629]
MEASSRGFIDSVVTLNNIASIFAGGSRTAHTEWRAFQRMVAGNVIDFSEEELPLTFSSVEDKFKKFPASDDVFNPNFSGLLIIQTNAKAEKFSVPVGIKAHIQETIWDDRIPEGPYFVKGSSVHQAWRLYPDQLNSFMAATVLDDAVPYKFRTLPAAGYDGLYQAVAVPSRLYSNQSEQKLLDGMRITVKDNIHLDGMVTTLGCRAFAQYYGVQNATSDYLKGLIDLGAVIVGKTKLSSFAGTEAPPKGPVDYFAPFNARGDGYQGPQGSSSGAGSATGGYDWIDASICTDTSGSCRGPAQINGVWALRTTWGSASLNGVVPSAQ